MKHNSPTAPASPAAMNISPTRIRLIALAMGLYSLLIIWPAIELLRQHYALADDVFTRSRLYYAAAISTAFGLYAYWQMKRLGSPSKN